MEWQALDLIELRRLLEKNGDWFLAGGQSLAVWKGESYRTHNDIDIGVLDNHAEALLADIQSKGFRIWQCYKGTLVLFESWPLQEGVHNCWVSDDAYFRFEIMLYVTEGSEVIFRRQPDVRWSKESFVIERKGVRLLNPLVTYAFKITNKNLEDKDVQDIQLLQRTLHELEF